MAFARAFSRKVLSSILGLYYCFAAGYAYAISAAVAKTSPRRWVCKLSRSSVSLSIYTSSACSMFSVLVSRMSRQMSYELSASRDISIKPGTGKPQMRHDFQCSARHAGERRSSALRQVRSESHRTVMLSWTHRDQCSLRNVPASL